jgi:hypothetical protein
LLNDHENGGCIIVKILAERFCRRGRDLLRAVRPRLSEKSEVQRNVGLIADDPTVMAWRSGWNMKNIASFQFGHGAVIYGGVRPPGDNKSNVLDTALCP